MKTYDNMFVDRENYRQAYGILTTKYLVYLEINANFAKNLLKL